MMLLHLTENELYDYCEGVAQEALAREIEHHIAACATCRYRVSAMETPSALSTSA
jgi:hypothetical protein